MCVSCIPGILVVGPLMEIQVNRTFNDVDTHLKAFEVGKMLVLVDLT